MRANYRLLLWAHMIVLILYLCLRETKYPTNLSFSAWKAGIFALTPFLTIVRFDSENTWQIESLITIKLWFGLESTVPSCGEIDFVNIAGSSQCGVFDHQPSRVYVTTEADIKYGKSPNDEVRLITTFEEHLKRIKKALYRNKIYVENM